MAEQSVVQWAYRAQKRLGVCAGVPDFQEVQGFDGGHQGARALEYSADGAWLAIALEKCVAVYQVQDTQTSLKHLLPIEKGIELSFSPAGTYLSTWERPAKNEAGDQTTWSKNLRVWSTATGQVIAEFERRQLDGCFFQFTADEAYCVRQAGSELQVFDPKQLANGTIGRLRTENIGCFQLGPGSKPSIAVFFPEKKGAPAFVKIFALTSLLSSSPTHSAQKSFFKADKITFKWNSNGSSLLLMTATDHDQTGKSYYGETNLYMLSARGDFDCRVSLDKEGPIHDFAWNPNAREFLVVYGYMPAKAVIFSYRVNVIADLGTQPRNLIAFNPQGRLFCLAGFGNLAGTVDIWDRDNLKQGKAFTLDASNSTTLQWAPDGHYLLTGTLSPRLRVENGLKIWHCSGKLIHVQMIDENYQLAFRPSAKAPPPFEKQIPAAPAPSAAAAELLARKTTTARPTGAYRPPGARSSGTSSSDYLRRNEDLGAAPAPAASSAKFVPPSAKGRRGKVPGAPPSSQPTGKANAASKPAMGAADVSAQSAEAQSAEKRLRNLSKKLKAIEQLKERRDKGETLEQTQLQKIQTEAEIRAEMQSL
ncbi:hypothetical protein MYAM1_002994 [Malassezia yamatoensis]|uniref:Eukaryotic translation initiation factor 2A n=1 Tax=Malassezia yamatoensis TaxID=253288 RepID=A0AAJ5YU55_9BASI|nr:hypothetical protein MYAM1_002994 [Malassezia yamatoensis]